MARKTTKKRMSAAPKKSTKQAKKDTYAIGGQTRAGKAMAQRRSRASKALSEAMGAARSARKRK